MVCGVALAGCLACEEGAIVYASAAPPLPFAPPSTKQCFYELCRGDQDFASVVPPGYCHCECVTGGAMTFESPWPLSPEYFTAAEAEWQALCPNAR